jgi:hypothetical protein
MPKPGPSIPALSHVTMNAPSPAAATAANHWLLAVRSLIWNSEPAGAPSLA